MVVELLKARLGMSDRRRQYTDIESVRDLEDVSDPATTANESKHTLRDTAHDHPYAAVLGSVVALIALGLGVMYTSRLAPGVLTNKWTYICLGVATYTGFVYRRGWSARDEKVTQYDELTLKKYGEQTTYKGTFIDLGGRAPAFIPIKGWERWGHKARPFLNADLGAAMVDSFTAHRMEGDAPAVIRLEPGKNGDLLSMSESDWGGKHLTQETCGLKPDPHGNQTSLYATFPEFDDDRANSFADQLEQMTADYYDVVEEVDSLKRRVRNLKDRLNEPIEDEVENRIAQYERLAGAANADRRQRRTGGVEPRPHQDDWRGTGTYSAQDEINQLEEELSDDDD